MEALGRGHDLNKLSQFLQGLQPLGPEVIQQELNVSDYIDRLGASLGLDTKGLIKSDEQRQQEQQATAQSSEDQYRRDLAMKVAPGAAKDMGGAISEQMMNQ
jgi:hypothetical protein